MGKDAVKASTPTEWSTSGRVEVMGGGCVCSDEVSITLFNFCIVVIVYVRSFSTSATNILNFCPAWDKSCHSVILGFK